jgi:hypothetical protein
MIKKFAYLFILAILAISSSAMLPGSHLATNPDPPQAQVTQVLAAVMIPLTLVQPYTITTVVTCDRAGFVKDVTIPDGYILPAGQEFTKTWRLTNSGTCTWSKDYDLVFYSGDQMSGANAIDLKQEVNPGQSIDLSVRLKAPARAGNYTGNWILRNASGVLFGIGTDAASPFWVSITVPRPPEVVYEFVDHYCEASWANGILVATSSTSSSGSSSSGSTSSGGTTTSTDKPGVIAIPCTTPESGAWGGPILVDAKPKLETGETDDEKALVLYPHFTKEAALVAVFPSFAVKSGDHFLAVVGCMVGAKDCKVTFTLEAQLADGSKVVLGTWKEKYDKSLTKIDVDLKQVAGKSVKFILSVKSTGTGINDHVFWLRPRIIR